MSHNLSEHYNLYDVKGEKLKVLFNESEFLDNKETRNILEENWKFKLETQIEPKLVEMINIIISENKNKGTTFFKNDKGGDCCGEIVFELFKHIKPKYDLEYFYNNPEMAKSLYN